MRCRESLWVTLLVGLLGSVAPAALDSTGVIQSGGQAHQDVRPFSLLSDGGPRPRFRRRLAQSGRLRTEERECRLKTLLLRVGDLGLGYDSEETVLFKYCGGGCSRSRTNHDLTLSRLLQKSDLPSLLEEKIFGGPCCRPTHYEDVAFLDDSHRWHTVEKLSAAACGCVG
ncbi:persephin [Bufo gargarizans]|uniref:persephin n=1 Tax=Bufo gargarizans TaxID=30331 RepID=UPI001CF579FE|nr:persephin [Bufo gargarizans]